MLAETYVRVARDLQKQQRYALSALTCLLLRDACARRSGQSEVRDEEIAEAVKEHHRLVLQLVELGDEFITTSSEVNPLQ